LVNESASEYDLLRDSIEDEIKSRDLREHLWVEDVVNAEWEIMRLRGFKVGMIHAVMPRIFSKQRAESEGFERVLAPDISLLRKHIVGVLAGDAKAKQELEKLLATQEMTVDLLTASAFEATIIPQHHTERMIAAAYERRNRAYAEIEYYRLSKQKKRSAASSVQGTSSAPNTEGLDAESIGQPRDVTEGTEAGLVPDQEQVGR
jgi:hypothetical protein